MIFGLKLTDEQQVEGMDSVLHAETGYDLGTVHGGGVSGGLSQAGLGGLAGRTAEVQA
jgi:hypothetical protein